MELVKYFNERNKTKENTVIEDKVGLGITSAKNVVTNLEEGDACKEILPLKDSIITNLKDKVVNLEGVSQNKSIMLISAEKSINSLRELSTLQKNLTDGLGRENKKLRVKSTLNKILLPIAIVGGFYLGTQIKR